MICRRSSLSRAATAALAASVALTLGAVAPPAAAGSSPAAAAAETPAPPTQRPSGRPTVEPAQRDAILGPGWRRSTDRLVATSGDGNGFHILTASARDGYSWRTVTTLAEPGFEADQWIGNACVTGSGRRLAVTYAPRTFTNTPLLGARGGFTAVVDLATGAVRKLAFQATLAYFSPGCGTGEAVLFTQESGDDQPAGLATRIVQVDASSGRAGPATVVPDQVTSAVPAPGGGILAAGQGRLLRVERTGRLRTLARTGAVPYRLVPDADGGVVFLDRQADQALVRRVATTAPGATTAPVVTLARGPLTQVELSRSRGQAYVTGPATWATERHPDTVTLLPAATKYAQVSTEGRAVLEAVTWSGTTDPRVPVANPDAARTVDLTVTVRGTGRRVSFQVDPAAPAQDRSGAGRQRHPALATAAARPAAARTMAASTGSPSDPLETERTCSVPRNNAFDQVTQPKPRQVEWAVDQAVRQVLTVQRPANWKNLGMPAYTPQGLFPAVQLSGGGYIPAQVALGVAAQESNVWQASSHVVPGETGNPLIGNYYGRPLYDSTSSNDWQIDWSKADCGYGVMQITDGMRLVGSERPGETAYPYQTQRAIALDFAVNVALGVRMLAQKWNETRAAGLVVNDGKPQYLENWFLAVWAYNSGFHPQSEAAANGGAWGVGWANNPANPRYKQNRDPFMDKTYADAAHPQDWPYPEKVLGFAGHPVEILEAPNTLVAAFRPAWWPGTEATAPANRAAVKPPVDLFCDTSNDCAYGAVITPTDPEVAGEPAGPCAHRNAAGQYDLKCWYHEARGWKSDCSAACGRELLRFDPGWEYQADGTAYPPSCSRTGFPANAVIVDDVAAAVPPIRPGCDKSGWANGGTFTLDFGADAAGNYPSKVDFHQLGGGFGSHFWFAYTHLPGDRADSMKVTATWRPYTAMNGWTRIRVHIPDHGAWTQQARYVIDLGNGLRRFRVVNQARQANTWVDLGVFPVAGVPSVRLSTDTQDGKGEDNVAFDAVAFVPTVRPSAVYVALGDSYSSGEGVEPYDLDSDYRRITPGRTNACHRSAGAYSRLVRSPGHSQTIAAEAAAGTASYAFIACAGSMSTSVTVDSVTNTEYDRAGYTPWGQRDQHYGEVEQVDQGYLDEDTTLVTLSIGGNDARFADVLRGCLIVNPVEGCYADSYKLRAAGSGVLDPKPLNVFEREVISDLLPGHLAATYRAIHRRAPNAKIIVMGYPQLFGDWPDVPLCGGVGPETMRFMNAMGGMLSAAVSSTVTQVRGEGIDISFVDPTHQWRRGAGSNDHWLCGGDPWVAGALPTSSTGSGTATPGSGSFHPLASGQAQFAALINQALAGASGESAVQQRIQAYVASRAADGWTITSSQALAAARRCLALTAAAGLYGDPCMHEPILFTTAKDAPGPAATVNFAIAANPQWVRQAYVDSQAKQIGGFLTDWMNRDGIVQTQCPAPRPSGYACAEYPFFTTELGVSWDPHGAGATSPNSTKLTLVPIAQHAAVTGALTGMASRCAIPSGSFGPGRQLLSNGGTFLTVPLLDTDTPRTFSVC
ncbi:GDSL-type esterase/lipase family protein [Micromonospora sp. HK10]|uniref:golvesin C-terminal-like domain-containing protein n=1 Tax=Micromonospora sp. HK10 TaxID=1538294 RepID=UPI0006983629|nr:GDSL-type esterase/lipase family protein [Micromonospora sp. HK10]